MSLSAFTINWPLYISVIYKIIQINAGEVFSISHEKNKSLINEGIGILAKGHFMSVPIYNFVCIT